MGGYQEFIFRLELSPQIKRLKESSLILKSEVKFTNTEALGRDSSWEHSVPQGLIGVHNVSALGTHCSILMPQTLNEQQTRGFSQGMTYLLVQHLSSISNQTPNHPWRICNMRLLFTTVYQKNWLEFLI